MNENEFSAPVETEDDSFDELDSVSASPVPPSADSSVPSSADSADEMSIPVRYDHADMKIPVNEAIPLIQKGLNYDRVIKERDRLREPGDPFETFARRFPEAAADPESIPEAVWNDFRGGIPLTEGWLRYENARISAELEAAKTALTNKTRITGSRTGRGSGLSGGDGFLTGFGTD